MNGYMFLIVFLLFLTTAGLGNNTPAVRWGHQFVTDTDDIVRAAVAGSNGGIYFAIKWEISI